MTGLFHKPAGSVMTITVADGTRVQVTEQHPFYVADRGWVMSGRPARRRPADPRDGGAIPITAITIHPEATIVYNFEVAGDHNYYVTNAQLLVHNCDISSHARSQMEARGVSQEQVDLVLEREPFSYWHEDQWKSGFYDPGSKVFVAKTIDGTVNTVMTNVSQAYVTSLQRRRP